MSDFWSVGEDHEVPSQGTYELAVVHRPFPGESATLPPNDPGRAREFVASFGTIAAVLAELEPVSAAMPDHYLWTRRDLDLVHAACWGNVSVISDPALAHHGETFSVLRQAEALRERFPYAAIIGTASVDHDSPFSACVLFHPDGTSLFAAGWHGQDGWTHEGDVNAAIEAFGIRDQVRYDFDIDLDDDVNVFHWEGLAYYALESVASRNLGHLTKSAFRVRHTKEATLDMEETWLGAPRR